MVEAPSGLAAVSLLLAGAGVPPIRRRGDKVTMAPAVLAGLGLNEGRGAARYVWADADPGVRAVLRAYADPALAHAVADVLDRWAGLRARAVFRAVRGQRLEVPDVESPEQIAGYLVHVGWSVGFFGGRSSFAGPGKVTRGGNLGWAHALTADRIAERLRAVAAAGIRADVLHACPSAAELAGLLGTPGDLSGVVAYIDPPYAGRCPYPDHLPREEVQRLALDYHQLGARVGVSEAEPVDLGWPALDITPSRYRRSRPLRGPREEFLMVSPC